MNTSADIVFREKLKTKTTTSPLLFYCLFVLMLGNTAAVADITVATRLIIKTVDEHVVGNITTEVVNVMGVALQNLFLRLVDRGAISIEQEVLQFGWI